MTEQGKIPSATQTANEHGSNIGESLKEAVIEENLQIPQSLQSVELIFEAKPQE